MEKTALAKKALLGAIMVALVAGALALAGCSCSSAASSSSSSSMSTSDAMTVPNVVSLAQPDAEKAIAAAGFKVGTVKREASDTVRAGCVISQDPKATTSAKAGSAVNLVVSSGKANPKDVTVPDLKGKTQADAEKALADVKLVGIASNPEETDEVAPGQVFKQSVAAGATAKEGDKIAFTVALAPHDATVPDVVGKVREDAQGIITGAGFGFDYTTSYNDDVPENVVISQSIAAGTQVKSGTTVSVVVSLGPTPTQDVKVPDVMTYSWKDAEAALLSAGLQARYTGDPAGTVVAQDIPAGTEVAQGTLVTVTLETHKPGQNPIMNFIGNYGADRAQVHVEAMGDNGGRITVRWATSATEGSKWVMSGTFDPGSLTLSYSNCVKTNYTADQNGNVGGESTAYTDGSGKITFHDATGLSLTWDDNQEHVADGITFTYGS